jgi:hypothetical protein
MYWSNRGDQAEQLLGLYVQKVGIVYKLYFGPCILNLFSPPSGKPLFSISAQPVPHFHMYTLFCCLYVLVNFFWPFTH